jgi:hypothetical protein
MADAGIGEAMLISAAVGAGTGAAGSAISGGDPLKGALMGAATGAVTGGAMGAFSGGAGNVGAGLLDTAAIQSGASGTGGFVPAAGSGASFSTPVAGAIPGYSAAAVPTVTPPVTPPPTPSPNVFGMSNLSNTQLGITGAGTALQGAMAAERNRYGIPPQQAYNGPLSKFSYDPNTYTPQPYPVQRYADGGIAQLSQDKNFTSGGMYPGSQIDHTQYASSPQTPMSMQATLASYDPETNPLTGEPTNHMAKGGIAGLLKGRGDGMSDSIHATIADRQPARLADGEFVVPADVVSHLGNGSTDAGAKHLYKMMDKVRSARTGNKKQGKQIKAGGYLPV